MEVQNSLLKANQASINSDNNQENIVLDNIEGQNTHRYIQFENDEEQQQQIDQNQSLSQINQSQSVIKIRDITYVTAILLTFSFLLLSLSLHLEAINIYYSQNFQNSYVLGGLSGTFLLAFGILIWQIPLKRVSLLFLSLFLCVIAQIYFLTFILSLTKDIQQKEMGIIFSYFVTSQIALFSLSYTIKIDGNIKMFTICGLLVIATVVCLLKFYYLGILVSGFFSGSYASAVMFWMMNKYSKQLNESILFAIYLWLALIPTIIVTLIICLISLH